MLDGRSWTYKLTAAMLDEKKQYSASICNTFQHQESLLHAILSASKDSSPRHNFTFSGRLHHCHRFEFMISIYWSKFPLYFFSSMAAKLYICSACNIKKHSYWRRVIWENSKRIGLDSPYIFILPTARLPYTALEKRIRLLPPAHSYGDLILPLQYIDYYDIFILSRFV